MIRDSIFRTMLNVNCVTMPNVTFVCPSIFEDVLRVG